jgi:D-beta-D-heptose 7-phosphate kinase/D-beta-D-heptose 1-phosphate adenosyltransferase
MRAKERAEILLALRAVDEVVIYNSTSDDVSGALERAYRGARERLHRHPQIVFANGGDRHSKNTPESEVCKRLGIELAYNVGGKKVQSSSKLLEEWSPL